MQHPTPDSWSGIQMMYGYIPPETWLLQEAQAQQPQPSEVSEPPVSRRQSLSVWMVGFLLVLSGATLVVQAPNISRAISLEAEQTVDNITSPTRWNF